MDRRKEFENILNTYNNLNEEEKDANQGQAYLDSLMSELPEAPSEERLAPSTNENISKTQDFQRAKELFNPERMKNLMRQGFDEQSAKNYIMEEEGRKLDLQDRNNQKIFDNLRTQKQLANIAKIESEQKKLRDLKKAQNLSKRLGIPFNEPTQEEINNVVSNPFTEEKPKEEPKNAQTRSTASVGKSETKTFSKDKPEDENQKKISELDKLKKELEELGNKRGSARNMDALLTLAKGLLDASAYYSAANPNSSKNQVIKSSMPTDIGAKQLAQDRKDLIDKIAVAQEEAKTNALAQYRKDQVELQKLQMEDKLSDVDKILLKNKLDQDLQIEKENRKEKQQLEEALPKLNDEISNLRNAYRLAGEVPTGPIIGLLSRFTEKGQELETALNKKSLKTMADLFAGMSKAVDSEAERKFFQSAQAEMAKWPKVNRKLLSEALTKAEGLRSKIQTKLSGGSRQQKESQKTGKSLVNKQYSPSRNKTKLIYSDGSEEIVDGKK